LFTITHLQPEVNDDIRGESIPLFEIDTIFIFRISDQILANNDIDIVKT